MTGDIQAVVAGTALQVGQAVVETEVGGRIVRAVVGAGGKVVRVIDDLGPASGPGRYVTKTETKAAEAAALEERVAFGRPGETYRVPYQNPNRRGRPYVDFDGAAPNGMPIDSKVRIVTSPKTVNQATRQAEALRQSGQTGVWKVTSYREALRARSMVKRASAADVIRIVVEK